MNKIAILALCATLSIVPGSVHAGSAASEVDTVVLTLPKGHGLQPGARVSLVPVTKTAPEPLAQAGSTLLPPPGVTESMAALPAIVSTPPRPLVAEIPDAAWPAHGYWVHAGSWLGNEYLLQAEERLRQLGLSPIRRPARVQEVTYQRVILGPYASREQAQQVFGKLKRETDMDPHVIAPEAVP
ncbi:MAG: SPOR domain-containing protein [Magnetococcus sp. WYHC-3]